MKERSIGPFLCKILRHEPEIIGIKLDDFGWANVDELVEKIRQRRPFSREALEKIVREDNKQRYSFNEDKTLIRANQGHSIPVDVGLPVAAPPEYLWHGTGKGSEKSIDRSGLLPSGRLYVHLSNDKETACKVGGRHGEVVLYRVASGRMERDGYIFYLSVNGVWLTKHVPAGYLEKAEV